MAAGTENLEVMAEAENYNAFLLDLVRRAAPEGCRVLDFGAGSGTFAKPMAREGREVVCVEPNPVARAQLAAEGLEVHATLAGVPMWSVDGLYSLNVLEHVSDDAAALRALYDCVRPGGVFVLYVPAFQWLFTSMDRRVGHLRRYRRAELVELVTAAGFEVRRARYVDSLGVLATLVYRLMKNDDGQINRRALRLYDRLIFPLSHVVDRLIGGVVGKNLLIESRRPGEV